MMPTTLSNPIGIPASGLLLENYWSKIKKTDQKSRGDRASRNQVRLVLLVWLEHGIGNFSLPLSIETSIFKYIGDCPITFGAPLRTGWCVQFVQFEPGFLCPTNKSIAWPNSIALALFKAMDYCRISFSLSRPNGQAEAYPTCKPLHNC